MVACEGGGGYSAAMVDGGERNLERDKRDRRMWIIDSVVVAGCDGGGGGGGGGERERVCADRE